MFDEVLSVSCICKHTGNKLKGVTRRGLYLLQFCVKIAPIKVLCCTVHESIHTHTHTHTHTLVKGEGEKETLV